MTNKLIKHVALSGILYILTSSSAFAVQDLLFNNIRQMGMGGAGIAVVDDVNALYQNPAALDKIKGTHFRLLDPRFDASTDYLSLGSKISDLSNGTNSEQIDKLKALVPAKVGFNAAGTASFSRHSFGIGLFTQTQVVANLLRPSSPRVELSALADTSVMIGKSFNRRLLNRQITWGITGKYISRYMLIDPVTHSPVVQRGLAETVDIINGNAELPSSNFTGSGFGVDLGMLMPISTRLGTNAQMGVVVKNIGANLSGDNTIGGTKTAASSQIPIVAGVGVGMESKVPVVGNILWAGDYYFAAENGSFWKNLHFGAEKKVLKRLSLRGGLNEGYMTAGLGLNLWVVRLDYTYFQQALGNIGINEQRYHVIQIGIGL